MTIFLKKYANQIGIAASGLCLVHCLLMPFILAFWLQADHCTPGTHCHDEGGGFQYDYLFLAFECGGCVAGRRALLPALAESLDVKFFCAACRWRFTGTSD